VMVDRLLISSASGKIPLIRALRKSKFCQNGNIELVAGDSDENSLSFFFCDLNWIMPRTIDANLTDIVDGCLNRSIRTIIPTRDGELLFYAKNFKFFTENGIQILIPSLKSIEQCLDKKRFSDLLLSWDIPVVPSFLELNPKLGSRMVVKERFGSGSKLLGLDLSSHDALIHASTLQNPIFQPMIFGKEFSVDLWVSNDLSQAISSPRIRDIVIDGEAKVTTTFHDDKIEELSLLLARRLGITGISVLQGFILDDGSLMINECNTRFGGASTAALNSGIPLIDLALYDLAGKDTKALLNDIEWKPITQVRANYDYCF
jgi:carbamoyl-phosphate synthase large subunit